MSVPTNTGLNSLPGNMSGEQPAAVNLKFRLRWYFRRWLPKLGWPGILAIGLLAVWISFYLSVVRPLQTQLDDIQLRANQVQRDATDSAKGALQNAVTPVEQLAVFYDYFPEEKETPRLLEKMVAVAGKSGFRLNDGEYKVTRDKVGNLLRLSINLPVKATYPQIRRFLALLPGEIPNMALEKVQFQRSNIVNSVVQAKISLVLYMVRER